MSQELYYTAPGEDIFNEMKQTCILVWRKYDDTHGYATEKIGRIKDLENISDNFMYMYAMFDDVNQIHVRFLLSERCRIEVQKRLS